MIVKINFLSKFKRIITIKLLMCSFCFLPKSICTNKLEKKLDIISGHTQNPLSDEDEEKLIMVLHCIQGYYTLLKDEPETYKEKEIPLYLKLDFLDNLLNRNQLYKIPEIKKNNIVPILLKLSISEHKEIHISSLSILASLTYYLPEIIDDLIKYHFYDSININLQLPFFPEKRHVFRWIYNFLINHKELSQQFFEEVPIANIFQSAINYLMYEENTFCQVMFLHISLLKNLTIDQVQACMSFFNFCLNRQSKKGIHNVLYGIHKIISRTKEYPNDLLCKFVIDLNLEKVISYYIQQDKINRKKGFSFCLLGDLFELGFQRNANLIPCLLQVINFDDLAEWFLQIALKAIQKILSFCDDNLFSKIFATGIYAKMKDILTYEAYYCFCLFLKRTNEDEILDFLAEEYVDLICTIVLSDDIDLITMLITGFIRFIDIVEMKGYLSILSDYFTWCDGFQIFEERFSTDDVVSTSLLSVLHQSLDKLSEKYNR